MSVTVVVRVFEMECWDVEESSPVVCSVSGIGIVPGQEIEILLRFSESRVAFEVDFVDPQFLTLVFVSEDFEKHLVHSLFREERMMAPVFPRGVHGRERWCSMFSGIRCIGSWASWFRGRGRRSSCRDSW